VFQDEFCRLIERVIYEYDVKSIIEIGPSSGKGSTGAILRGIRKKSSVTQTQLHLIEIDEFRCALLKLRFKKMNNVTIYNGSSISIDEFPSWEEVKNFYSQCVTKLNKHSLETIEKWYYSDKMNINALPISRRNLIGMALKKNSENRLISQ
jgi:phospholipid N-methyltransferase